MITKTIDHTPRGVTVDLVVPVHNEAATLRDNIELLVKGLDSCPWPWRVTIADNASTDGTWAAAAAVAESMLRVRAVHVSEKGRGRALRAAWLATDAEVAAYCDIDLSTDLRAFVPLVAPVVSGHSELAIGTRLARGARVERGTKREIVSRSYNFVLRTVAHAGFTDAQCGFKAIRSDVARDLLADVENENWFFDTELLLLAERRGLRIHEVPVDWVDDPDSRVRILSTALEDLGGVARLTRTALSRHENPLPLAGQAISFAVVGSLTTALHLRWFAALRPVIGSVQANAVSLAAASIINTELNQAITFARPGGGRAGRRAQASTVALLSGIVTTAALTALHQSRPNASAREAQAMLLAANAAIAAARFTLLRAWVYAP